MNHDERIEQSAPASRFIIAVAILMAAAYLGVGLYFMLQPQLFPDFSPIAIRILGGLVTVYGFYRAYRVYQTYFVA